jgi:hypothetical protein
MGLPFRLGEDGQLEHHGAVKVDLLRIRRVNGEIGEIGADVEDAESPAGEYLTTRRVRLAGNPDNFELDQHRAVAGDARHRQEGYVRLDNEILAGRRLYEVAGPKLYPPELARLYGDEAATADPYALWEPYRGEPLRACAEGTYPEELETFATGLMAGLCWLAGAGIAHRAISPDTVRWDGYRVQITDFSRCVPFGMARTPMVGSTDWVARESRPDLCYGTVGPSDDVWAAVRLIYFFRTRGKDLRDRADLEKTGLEQMFNGTLSKYVFGPVEERPTASDLVEYGLRRPYLIPSVHDLSMQLRGRRGSFLNARDAKHSGAEIPAGFWDDVTWRRSLWGGSSAGGGAE